MLCCTTEPRNCSLNICKNESNSERLVILLLMINAYQSMLLSGMCTISPWRDGVAIANFVLIHECFRRYKNVAKCNVNSF